MLRFLARFDEAWIARFIKGLATPVQRAIFELWLWQAHGGQREPGPSAEPVAALFESKRAKLAGAFPELEDELCGLTLGGTYRGPGRSPDRADAMVWALWALLIAPRQLPPSVRGL